MAGKTINLVLAVCLAFVATACGSDSVDVSAQAEVAIADLASRQAVDAGDIEVVSEEEVTWRDGSLGCGEPGGASIQVLTPGFRIILELDGAEYSYHGRLGQDPVFCESPDPNGTV